MANLKYDGYSTQVMVLIDIPKFIEVAARILAKQQLQIQKV
ncbi:Uncharacterised protein [Yersinia similis]|uniref:Uncharacterized protein n=1 Tax=Yersinia similis TaxID=367190 RepID=A0A0T9RJB0_9GAMM|nr:Uncharacterised protein [Yersinia similis]CNC26857.1 Uncharacterised protein [Yersinia similis]CNE98532.1 Uncharacterised protein [Yersinia similis]CNF01452.1 Uncharacterised protein [Yersinia similis]CNI66278.1 Uncharacterised protein [Yersinia similis]